MGGQTKQVGSASDTKILNKDEQGTRKNALSALSSTAGNYDNFIKQLMSGYGAGGTTLAQDPTAAASQLLSLSPEMQSTAASVASQGLNQYGQSAQELANITSRDAMRSTANDLAAGGLLNSGAANAALLEASYAPQAQLQTNLAGLYNTSYNNAYNNLLGQEANVFGQQMSNNLGLTSLGLQGLDQQASAYGSLADLTSQQYYTPQYSAGSGLTDILMPGLAGAGTGFVVGGPWGAGIGGALGLGAGLYDSTR